MEGMSVKKEIAEGDITMGEEFPAADPRARCYTWPTRPPHSIDPFGRGTSGPGLFGAPPSPAVEVRYHPHASPLGAQLPGIACAFRHSPVKHSPLVLHASHLLHATHHNQSTSSSAGSSSGNYSASAYNNSHLLLGVPFTDQPEEDLNESTASEDEGEEGSGSISKSTATATDGAAEQLQQPDKKRRIRRRNPDSAPQKKPNPWGDESYADLIARALSGAPGGRLKLSEVYQWFSDTIPYFAARSSQEEAQGWKNSIRHNLSLHSRFMRVQNEGAGKSSWWVLNPDAKPGRNPRRRAATMESATKPAIDKKRRGARKRVEIANTADAGGLHSAGTSQLSLLQQEGYSGGLEPGDMDSICGGVGGNFETFRQRTQSMLSTTSQSSRVPNTAAADFGGELDWIDSMAQHQATGPGRPQQHPQFSQQQQPQMNEIRDKTDQMRIIEAAAVSVGNAYDKTPAELLNGGVGPALNEIRSNQLTNVLLQHVKTETGMSSGPTQRLLAGQLGQQLPLMSHIKMEKDQANEQQQLGMKVLPPPAYQELGQQPQKFLIRTLPQQLSTQGGKLQQQQYISGGFQPQQGRLSSQPLGGSSGQWSSGTLQGPLPYTVAPQQQPGEAPLPHDLENLTLSADQSMMDFDMESVLRHDLNLSRDDDKLQFDL